MTANSSADPLRCLEWIIRAIANIAGTSPVISRKDADRLRQSLEKNGSPTERSIEIIFESLGVSCNGPLAEISSASVPCIAFSSDQRIGVRIIRGKSTDKRWLAEGEQSVIEIAQWPPKTSFFQLVERPTFHLRESATDFFRRAFEQRKSWVIYAALASTAVSILMLATSLFSMQVYDRVIGQGGIPTLIVLSIGVIIAIVFELLIKLARSKIIESATTNVDLICSEGVFSRMMKIRLDQIPSDVGTLTSQVRGFETVRAFKTSVKIFLYTDAPFAIFFLLITALIGGAIMAIIPLVALLVSISIGLAFKRSIIIGSANLDKIGNKRQGFLIESLIGLETIKSAGAAWNVQNRWNLVSSGNAEQSSHMRALNERATHFLGFIQQLSYVALVAIGAYLAVESQALTVGSIIACSIVSGRVLSPINQLSMLLVQWGNAKVALKNMDGLFNLCLDNHHSTSPIKPESISGQLGLRNVRVSFSLQNNLFSDLSLNIQPSEKVAIIGPIGAGKSTLLKLMSGLVPATNGQVVLDGMDIQTIDAERRARFIGYLPQSVSLFSGTLRENLTFGGFGRPDQEIMAMCETTGLAHLVRSRAEGLDLKISEGGSGISGGQRQLIALTRLMLAQPRVWLLDEPTGSFDEHSELHFMNCFKATVPPSATVVVVTHKPRLLNIVDRIIVVDGSGVAFDGPKDKFFTARQTASAGDKGVSVLIQKPPAPAGIVRGSSYSEQA